MERRWAGVMLLVLAVLTLLVAPRVFRPGLPGQAAAAPLPGPPPIGTCVDFVPRRSVVVDCAELHDGEIFAHWTADDPSRPRDRSSTICDGLLAGYLRITAPTLVGWTLAVHDLQTRVIRAPRAERVGDRAWSACVLRPTTFAGYRGTVGATVDGAVSRPAVFGQCATATDRMVSCSTSHQRERLATSFGIVSVADDPTVRGDGLPVTVATQLDRECITLAGQLTGNPDPTFGGRLAVEVVPVGDAMVTARTESFLSYAATCVLTSTGQPLLASVAGVGAGPLPTG